MKQNEVTVDLPNRTETRIILQDHETFLNRLEPYFRRIRFSDKECVHTLYFDNDSHTVPFDLSLKARRYIDGIKEHPVLDNDNYFVEIKGGKREQKHKRRYELSLSQAKGVINEQFSGLGELRPYVSTQYRRQHYVPKDSVGIRITVDTDVCYYFFPEGSSNGFLIGNENYPRLEIKESNPNPEINEFLQEVLKEFPAFPLISKKFSAFNFLSSHLKIESRKKKSFNKDLCGYEIESKLIVESEDVFRYMRDMFEKGIMQFQIPAYFPFTTESASINRYYMRNGDVFKAMLKGNRAKIITKSCDRILSDPENLGCLIKRNEEKGKYAYLWSGLFDNADLIGELRRKRKAFWVDNVETDRFYHITVDLCESQEKDMYQMEVEYTGTYKDPPVTDENEIIRDITDITKIIINKNANVQPSITTKAEWLGI